MKSQHINTVLSGGDKIYKVKRNTSVRQYLSFEGNIVYEISQIEKDKYCLILLNMKQTKKDLNGPDNHYDLITHLETDILEFEVK